MAHGTVNLKVPQTTGAMWLECWLRPDGALVNRDDQLCCFDMELATLDLPSPAAGILRHLAQPGDQVRPGGVIGQIDSAE
jgi:pyruvate/2-oxoglutarate dehydrogenase complex dihydrolipoamide acyltransferase (E2) component